MKQIMAGMRMTALIVIDLMSVIVILALFAVPVWRIK